MLKFILIYNLNLSLHFLFLFTSSIALIDARRWLLFSMASYFIFGARPSWSRLQVQLLFSMAFYFIFGARPSWSSLQVQLNLIISFHYSARRLRGVYVCLTMVRSPTSAKIAYAALWDLGAWRAPTAIVTWNIFKNSKWI